MRILVSAKYPTMTDLGRLVLDFGYEVVTHSDFQSALQVWSRGECDMALISITVSHKQPLAIMTAFRESRPHAPLLIVSEMAALEDRVAALDAGADDYITVPFAIPELRARLNAAARHNAVRLPGEICVGPLLMRPGDPTVIINGESVELLPRERILLEMFALSSNRPIGIATIAMRFGMDTRRSNAAIAILVHRLRGRLRHHGVSIVNLRGVGYCLQFLSASAAASRPTACVALPAQVEPAPLDVPLNESFADADPENWNTRLLEYTNDAIIIWEMQGRGILYWNAAAEQLYEYSRRVALGRITHVLLKTQLSGGVTSLESNLARYGVWIGELTHTTRTGRRILVEGRLALMSQRSNRWLVLEVNRDITDQKTAASTSHDMQRQLDALRSQRKV